MRVAVQGTDATATLPLGDLPPASTASTSFLEPSSAESARFLSLPYAVFHAPTYRSRYAAFLKTDFPRLPLPPDAETFHALAALGAKLAALHLLEDPRLRQHGIAFPISGDHTVKKMRAADRYLPPLLLRFPQNWGPGVSSPAPHYWGGGASWGGGPPLGLGGDPLP